MNLQVGVNDLKRSEPEVRMLVVVKGPRTTFGTIVGGLPSCVVQEHAQVGDVVSIEMPLLLVERREVRSCRVLVPSTVPLLSFGG